MLCPKCRRPLDGEEVYICCGDGALEWRCTACRKVSEGFAFPYGQCPHCGRELEEGLDFCHWCTEPLPGASDADAP